MVIFLIVSVEFLLHTEGCTVFCISFKPLPASSPSLWIAYQAGGNFHEFTYESEIRKDLLTALSICDHEAKNLTLMKSDYRT